MPIVETTGTYIKRYDFWNPATWTIPSLYWDTFSQEQRIHAICRQLSKVIQYADYVGTNTDEVITRLKAIEEGQLDEFIVDAIEEWFNENQPAIMQALEDLQNSTSNLNDIIPASEFSAESTVKDVIDGLQTQTQESIDGINDNIDAIETDIGNLENIIPASEFSAESTVKDAIDGLQTQTQTDISNLANIIPASEFSAESTVKDAIDAIDDAIGNIVNKNADVIIIGDSYVHDNVTSLPKIASALATLIPNWNIFNAGDAGSAFTFGGENGRNYKQQFDYAKTAFANFAQTKAVLICGSRNEVGGYHSPNAPSSNLKTYVDECIEDIQTSLPDARIYIFPGLWDWTMPNSNLQATNIIIQQSALDHNVFCARGCWTWGIGQESELYNGGNDIHPNAAGCNLMAKYIRNAIQSNDEHCWVNRFVKLGSDGGSYHINVWTDEDNINMMGAWVQSSGDGNLICDLNSLPLWMRWYDRNGNIGLFMVGYGYSSSGDNAMAPVLFSQYGLTVAKGSTVLPSGHVFIIHSTQSVFYTN